MTDFDSESIWKELEQQEESLRSKHKSIITDKKVAFWRQKSSKQNKKKQPKDRWNIKSSKLQNEDKSIKTKSRINSIKHAMNLLKDNEFSLKIKLDCVDIINQYLEQTEDDINDNSMDILKCIISLFISPFEPLRNVSIDIIFKYIGIKWDYKQSIKYIIPIIVHCILGQNENGNGEKSEEIRLKHLNLIEKVINIAKNEEELKPICGDLVGILIKLLNDSYHEINKKSCIVMIKLASKVRLNAVSKIIISNCLHLLNDKHSSIRIECVKLIENMLINHSGHEMIQTLAGFREHNNVPLSWWFGGEIRENYFGKLCFDKNINVRNTFYKFIFNLMIKMKEKYDYKTLLLSYCLSALQDKNKNMQSFAFDKMEQIGKLHEMDEYNADHLRKELFYQKQVEMILKKDMHNFKYPFPFKQRPCLGIRILIREHFGMIISNIIDEYTKDWKNECREMSIKLIKNMMIYSEEYITKHTEILLNAFYKTILNKDINNDDNKILLSDSLECISLIGKFVHPQIFIDYLSDIIHHDFNYKIIIMFYCLLIQCPQSQLISSINRQIIVLMKYSLSLIVNDEKKEMKNEIIGISKKIANAEEINNTQNTVFEDDQKDEQEEEEENYLFSSEYCGFHIEIIDQTEPMENNDKLSLKERIDVMLKEFDL